MKTERERLKHNQTVCAELGGVTRKTLFNYESGETAPSGAFLLAIAEHGYDSAYILFGQRLTASTDDMEVVTAPERRLLANYRKASTEGRALLDRMAELESQSQPVVPRVIKGHGNQIGNANSSNVTISKKPKPRK